MVQAAGLDPSRVEAGAIALSHRGPDAVRIASLRGATLGHARLSVVDLREVAHQPMRAGPHAIVFNGEIYNHLDLRRELEARGHVFRTRSDTEALLHGYAAWGDDVVRRAEGMFAFAIFDEERQRLLLATDRPGKKPLFYAEANGCFYFASEPKALFAMGVPAALNAEQLPNLLTLGYVPAPDTLHHGVRQLPPASMAVRTGTKPLVVQDYWRPPFAEPRLQINEHDAIAEVRRRVEEAVLRRLEADVPLGAFLSGGLDSSIIVAIMRKHLGAVRTFSIGFAGDARYDETAYAREVAQALGTQHEERRVGPDAADAIPTLVWAHDGAFGDSSALPTSVVSGLAREHVTVALSGDGGDELFCGYLRLLAAEASARMPKSAGQLLSRMGRALPEIRQERGLYNRAARFLRGAGASLPERLVGYSPYFHGRLPGILAFPSEGAGQPLRFTRDILAEAEEAGALGRVLHHNYRAYLPYDLLVKADRSSMLHSLELRAPFLDLRLAELAARLPDHLLRRFGTTKWVLRKAFEDVLPHSVLHRPKMGFGVPLTTWFRGALRPMLHDTLGPGALCRQTLLAGAAIDQLLDEHQSERVDHTHRLWLLLTLELWLQRLRGASPWLRP